MGDLKLPLKLGSRLMPCQVRTRNWNGGKFRMICKYQLVMLFFIQVGISMENYGHSILSLSLQLHYYNTKALAELRSYHIKGF